MSRSSPFSRPLSRRTLLKRTGQTALTALAFPNLMGCMQTEPTVPLPDRQAWDDLDETIKGWWDGDVKTATEADVAADPKGTLLYLPRPYLTPGGSEAAFNEMYGWDTFFINLGLLAHGRLDLIENHIVNHLHMIKTYGMVLNGSRTYYLGRSQPPLLAESVRLFLDAGGNTDVAAQAYGLLEREYEGYWEAEHHTTPVGLTTNRDLFNEGLRAELAAEAETGLDFTALYGGDVRRCVPLITNCALVQYARALADVAEKLGNAAGVQKWQAEAERRAERLRDLCWDDAQEFFFEFDYTSGKRLPFLSLCAYWTLWAGIATTEQAAALVEKLPMFEQAHGLSVTDTAYPSPHPEFQNLQWAYPLGWPPLQIIVVEGLVRYGYTREAERIARRFVGMMLAQYAETGKLWEVYNAITGKTDVPVERYPPYAMHGWSSAAVVVLGRTVFS